MPKGHPWISPVACTGKQRSRKQQAAARKLANATMDRAMAVKSAQQRTGPTVSWWLEPDRFYQQAKAQVERMSLSTFARPSDASGER